MKKYKIGFVVLGLFLVVIGWFLYGGHNQSSLPEGILVRETMSAMGAQTVTTVSDSGHVTVVSDFPNQSTTYILTSEQLQEVVTMVGAEDGQSYTFIREKGVVYDGSYSLELRYKQSAVEHTDPQSRHEALTELIRTARPQ